MGFLVTAFGYTKVKMYLKLTDSTFYKNCTYRFLGGLLIIYGSAVLARFISTEAGQEEFKGVRLCTTPHIGGLEFLILLLFLSLNVSFLMIFYRLQDSQHESIPGLIPQMKLNLIVMPFIFLTTVILVTMNMIWVVQTKGYSPLFYLISTLIDNLVNNAVMHWSLFGNFQSEEFLDDAQLITRQDSEEISSSRMAVFSGDEYLPAYVWLSLPGAHPLKVKSSVVVDNGLEEYIIFEQKKIEQIRRYRERGFIQCLLCCCNSLEDMVDELDGMGFEEVEIQNALSE